MVIVRGALGVSGAIELVARPKGVRNWMLNQRSPRSSTSSATAPSFSWFPLVSVMLTPSSTPGGASSHDVPDAGEGLLEGLGDADVLRVGLRVGAVDARRAAW